MDDLITDAALEFYFLTTSEKLDETDRERYGRLFDSGKSESTITGSLSVLCRLLEKHYGKKVILLIDE